MKYHRKTKTHLNPSSKNLPLEIIDSKRNLLKHEVDTGRRLAEKDLDELNINLKQIKNGSTLNSITNKPINDYCKQEDYLYCKDEDSIREFQKNHNNDFDDKNYNYRKNSFSQISSNLDISPFQIEEINNPKVVKLGSFDNQLEKQNLAHQTHKKLNPNSNSQNSSKSLSNLDLNPTDLIMLKKKEELCSLTRQNEKPNISHNQIDEIFKSKLVLKKVNDEENNIVIIDHNRNSSEKEHKIDFKKQVVFKLKNDEDLNIFTNNKQNSSNVNNSHSQSQMVKQNSITVKDFKRRKSLFKELEYEIKQNFNENKDLEFLTKYKIKLLEPEDEMYTQFIYTKIQIDEFCSLIMNIAGKKIYFNFCIKQLQRRF